MCPSVTSKKVRYPGQHRNFEHQGNIVTATPVSSPETQEFVRRIDQAAATVDHGQLCQAVKEILKDVVARGLEDIPAEFMVGTDGDSYARRMLHQGPDKAYTVIVMVWQPGQITPIHDHAGRWCVECVLKGTMQIVGYDPVGDPAAGCGFAETKTVNAMPGNVGILRPPNEFHSLGNVSADQAVTIHVYEGEMLWCHTFDETSDGTFSRHKHDLTYTE